MTYLELVNGVLRRLREPTVTAIASSDYATLIGDFVNEAKREVEDAFEWVALRDTVQAVTEKGQYRYILNNVGSRFKIRSVYDQTSKNYLAFANSAKLTEKFISEGEQGQPKYYDFSGLDGDDYQLDMYPIPDGVYYVNINLIRPQLDLATDLTELKVHEYPVLLGAYAKAIAERGDDNGMQYQIAYKAYQDALSDAIQIDSERTLPTDLDWYPA